jgi:hypothetical protein
MEIDTMDNDVGVPEAGMERRAGRHPRNFFAVEGVEHQHGGWRICLFENGAADPNSVERVIDVGPELDAVAYRALVRLAFQHVDRYSMTRLRELGG